MHGLCTSLLARHMRAHLPHVRTKKGPPMTTDADLTVQIAQKLHEVDPISGHDPRWDRLLKMDREWYRIKATAVLPILRRAQAEAWDGGQMSADRDWATGGHARLSPYRSPVTAEHDGSRVDA